MTKDPYHLNPFDTIQQTAQDMKQHNVGCLPVCANGVLTGVITDRDIVLACVAANMLPSESTVRQYMTANPVCVSPETSLEEAIEVMAHEQIRRLCVTEAGRLVGIVSLGDLSVRLRDDLRIAGLLGEISEPVRSQPTRA